MLANVDPKLSHLTKNILIVLCYAKRPLTVQEVVNGVAVKLGEIPAFDSDDVLQHEEDIYWICPGLIEMQVSDRTLRIAHHSVQEYLESERIALSPSAKLQIKKSEATAYMASICLGYLLAASSSPHHIQDLEHVLDRFLNSGARDPDMCASVAERLRAAWPFYDYAAQHWDDHYHEAHTVNLVYTLAARLFSDEQTFCNWTWYRYYNNIQCKASPLYHASALGMDDIVSHLLEDSSGGENPSTSLDEIDWSFHGIPLQAAARSGHLTTVKLLLERGANINVQGVEFGTALQAALTFGHLGVAKFLIDKGADINARCDKFGTVLETASLSGNMDAVNLLFDNGLDIGTCQFEASLEAAVNGRHVGIVKMLLDKCTDLEEKRHAIQSVLQQPSTGYSTKDVIEVLFRYSADMNIEDPPCGVALHMAVKSQNFMLIKVLLSTGTDIDEQCDEHGTALQIASLAGCDVTARLLLSHGCANPNAQGGKYGTAPQPDSAAKPPDDTNSSCILM